MAAKPSIESATPPDETGSDTFARYVYQAHVAFAYCVNCGLLGGIEAVVLEHFEDLAINRGGGSWDFVQVKTRDADQGPWKLSDLLAKNGPLRSLYRTYRAVSKLDGEFRYVALLENSIRQGDPAKSLLKDSPGPSPEVIAKVAKAFRVSPSEAGLFLDKLELVDNLPPRAAIASANIRQLGLSAPNCKYSDIESVYRSVLSAVADAMDVPRLESRWPKAALTPSRYSGDVRERFHKKCLGPDQLGPLFQTLELGTQILLTQLADPAIRTTALEDKLRAAGHSEATVKNAKQLRAQAAMREAVFNATQLNPSAELEDVRMRLLVLAEATVDEVASEDKPPAHLWSRLQSKIEAQRYSLDQSSLFEQDAFVLLGELCEISDRCEFSWGIGDA